MKKKRENVSFQELWDETSKEYATTRRNFWGIVSGSFLSFASLVGGLVIFISSILIGTTAAAQSLVDSLPQKISVPSLSLKTNIFTKNEGGYYELMGVFYTDNREEVRFSQIPQVLKDAAIAAEDSRFYQHAGVDVQAIVRAAVNNASDNSETQGASSITQQYVKNILINKALQIPNEAKREAAYNAAIENSISRKIEEARYAMYLEKEMTKEEIIEGYFNIVGFGGNMYGIKVGAKYYFGKELSELSLNESAILVAIINNPNIYRIDVPESTANGEANGYAVTKERRDYVLKRMLEEGYITSFEYKNTLKEAIIPNITPYKSGCFTQNALFFCDYVRSTILTDERYGATPDERWNTFYRGGLTIYTTIDAKMQATAMASMEERVPFTSEVLKIGSTAVSVENSSGRILAMVQNKYFSNDPELAATDDRYTAVNYNTNRNRGGSSGFQTGSTFKLFTLIEWLKSGRSLNDVVFGKSFYTEMPNSCDGTGVWTGNYQIKNSGGAAAGYRSVMSATISSVNTAYMSMAEELDLCNIALTANALGVDRADGDGLVVAPSLVLGSNEISPLAMTGAYAAVGNNGVFCPTSPIESVMNSQGKFLFKLDPYTQCREVIPEEVNKAVLKALRNTISYGTASSGKPYDGSDMFAKTGTTDDTMDSWLIGGSSKVTTGIWVGNTMNKVTLYRLYANGTSAPYYRFGLFRDIMTQANLLYAPEPFPEPSEDFLD